MATTGRVTKEYVSSVDFLDTREILNKALDIQNEDVSFLDVLELTKRSVVTEQPEFYNFINEELYKLGVVSSISGTGASITINLTAGTSGSAKATDMVMFNDKRIGYVYSKSSAALVVKSVDGDALETSVSAGDNLSFFSQVSGEGSGKPDAERWTLTKEGGQVQIFKGAWGITDIQKVSAIEVEYGGKNYIMFKTQHDAFRKFQANINFAMLLSRKSAANFSASAPTLEDAAGNPLQTTAGLFEVIESKGIDNTMNGTTIALQDLQDLDLDFNLARCPKEYEMYVATAMNQQMDNYLNALGNGTILSQAARFQITQNLDLGVDSFKLYGRTYHKIYMPMLDHRAVTNYTGAPDYKDSAFFVPRGKIKVDNGADMVERLRVRYMSGDGTNMRYREVATGSLAGSNRTHDAVLDVSWESIQGLEALGGQHFGKLKPAAST